MNRKANGSKSKIPARTRIANCKVTPAQYETLERRAAECGLSMAAWMRHILLQAASRPAKDGYLRIHEPNGAMT